MKPLFSFHSVVSYQLHKPSERVCSHTVWHECKINHDSCLCFGIWPSPVETKQNEVGQNTPNGTNPPASWMNTLGSVCTDFAGSDLKYPLQHPNQITSWASEVSPWSTYTEHISTALLVFVGQSRRLTFIYSHIMNPPIGYQWDCWNLAGRDLNISHSILLFIYIVCVVFF